jgi:hypothetical protein
MPSDRRRDRFVPGKGVQMIYRTQRVNVNHVLKERSLQPRNDERGNLKYGSWIQPLGSSDRH